MSKKHHNQNANNSTAMSHAEEYEIIKFDLIKVVLLNVVYLGALVTLYYSNLHSHYLERWLGNILHF